MNGSFNFSSFSSLLMKMPLVVSCRVCDLPDLMVHFHSRHLDTFLAGRAQVWAITLTMAFQLGVPGPEPWCCSLAWLTTSLKWNGAIINVTAHTCACPTIISQNRRVCLAHIVHAGRYLSVQSGLWLSELPTRLLSFSVLPSWSAGCSLRLSHPGLHPLTSSTTAHPQTHTHSHTQPPEPFASLVQV